MDRRYYVTTLPFARDLCQAINAGINNPLAPATQEPRVDVEASPSKYSNYSETASRKRLGKRMLKLLQPYLEAALKAEAEVCRTAYEPLQNELEGILEASVEPRQPPVSSIIVSRDEGITPGHSQEIDMADAPVEGQIIVADHSEGEEDAEGELDDAMDGTQPGEDNIEVSYYDEPTPKPSGVFSAAHSVSGEQEHEDSTPHLTNGSTKPSNSPPSLPGASYTHLSAHNSKPNNHPPGAGPLTPPQSNTGSASFTAAATTNPLITVTAANNNSNTHNPLTDGGILWYLADFQLRGTTAVDPDSDSDMDVDGEGDVDVDDDDNGLLNHHHLVTHHRHNNTNTNNEEGQGQDGTQSQNHHQSQ
jgi:NuA3 HAT complex component NTO1